MAFNSYLELQTVAIESKVVARLVDESLSDRFANSDRIRCRHADPFCDQTAGFLEDPSVIGSSAACRAVQHPANPALMMRDPTHEHLIVISDNV
ncbi:hypothetical protein [Bradyrhizobium sp.]|jgi:hypothetical protein|uniref:hypothetical protein n=1 Tax=Bradyrhizobium sp. TaxID=376 RepID=UPI003C1C0A8E